MVVLCRAGEGAWAREAAAALGCAHVVELPLGAPWLVSQLAPERGSAVLAVVGAVGGVGATTVAIACAVGAGADCLLVDADPDSPGLDLPLGHPGGRRRRGGRRSRTPPDPLDPGSLRSALPQVGRGQRGHRLAGSAPDGPAGGPVRGRPGSGGWPASWASGARSSAARWSMPGAVRLPAGLLGPGDALALVLPATLAGVVAGRRVLAGLPAQQVVVLLRPTGWLPADEVAEQLGVPVALEVPRLRRAAELADCGDLLSGPDGPGAAQPRRAGLGAARDEPRSIRCWWTPCAPDLPRTATRPTRWPSPRLCAASGLVLDRPGLDQLTRALGDELGGLGALDPLLRDPEVTDVLVNAPDEVWLDRGGGLVRAPVAFPDEAAVRQLAVRLASRAGRRLDDATPYVDARLPGGQRLHAVIPPLSVRGTTISLRIPSRRRFTLADLVAAGTVDEEGAAWLAALIRSRAAFLVSGGTGSGKTSVLGALLGVVPQRERIVVVEDTCELDPEHPHVVSLEARPANLEGQGEIPLRTLVRQALRMRPDRLVVGEVRGAEVVDLLAAMNTGHEGGCGTVHANSAAAVPDRLVALALAAGMTLAGRARAGQRRARGRGAPRAPTGRDPRGRRARGRDQGCRRDRGAAPRWCAGRASLRPAGGFPALSERLGGHR